MPCAHRHDATDDTPLDTHGKLHKLDHSHYQTSVMQYMLRVCRRAARVAQEAKPTLADIESIVKE